MKTSRSLFLLSLLSIILFSPECQAAPIPGDIDPYQVTLYAGYNYNNPIGTWTLKPDMRMLRVPQIGDQVVPNSILLGSKVGVLIFQDNDLSSILRYQSETVEEDSWFLIPYFRFVNSSPKTHYSVRDADYYYVYYHSLLLYRKDIFDMLGVFLYSGRKGAGGWGQFYPLPDDPNQSEIIYNKIRSGGPFDIQFVPSGQTDGFHSSFWYNLKATVTFSSGGSLMLPDPNKFESLYNLYKYNSGQISSIFLQYKGPFNNKQSYLAGAPAGHAVNAPPTPDFTTENGVDLPGNDYNSFFVDGGSERCLAACQLDPKCKAFTWVQPGVQGAKAVCWLKSGVSAPVSNKNCVSGYIKGTKPQDSLAGIKDTSVAKTYTASAVQKSVSAVATVSKITNVAGQWKGSNGLVYDIKQTKDRFEWTVKEKNENASGVLKGNDISASWKRELRSGSLEGKITAVDSTGKATQIDWTNGMRFFR